MFPKPSMCCSSTFPSFSCSYLKSCACLCLTSAEVLGIISRAMHLRASVPLPLLFCLIVVTLEATYYRWHSYKIEEGYPTNTGL